MNHPIKKLTTLALCLAFGVILLGAYTRLTDAGLGCPDWPGCYGKLIVSEKSVLTQPIEATKAWTEMIHRYFAGTLGCLIFLLGFLSYRHLKKTSKLPYALVALVLFQAALGMWTVTLKLLPVVVMGHLLGGMLILGGLVYFRWQTSSVHVQLINYPSWPITLGVVLVFLQIALGGWVSSNYAALACVGFPTCNGTWLPSLDFHHAFQWISATTLNYQGGLLDSTSRITIQFVHRVGAFIVLTYLSILLFQLYRHANPQYLLLRRFIALTFSLLFIQIGLGILNVIYLLPLSTAVLHNGIGASLFASMLSVRFLAGRSL